jgi:dolichyl-phosphate-mannose--protein O-mannosyl transferase
VWGRAGQGSWLQTRRIAVGVVLALAVLAFAFFWPVWTATYIPYEAWQLRMWNPTWI